MIYTDAMAPSDFLAGQRDCRDGVPHQVGRSESYNRGYSEEYAHQENVTATQIMRERDELA